MKQLDPQLKLEPAEQAGTLIRMKSGWRKFMWFAVFLMAILVITIPVAIWFGIVAKRATRRHSPTRASPSAGSPTRRTPGRTSRASNNSVMQHERWRPRWSRRCALAVAAASEIIANKIHGSQRTHHLQAQRQARPKVHPGASDRKLARDGQAHGAAHRPRAARLRRR